MWPYSRHVGQAPLGLRRCLLRNRGDLSVVAAKAVDPSSGRVLEVFTTQPGIQFYSGNQIKKPIHGVGGVYGQFSAMTFETQHFPGFAAIPATVSLCDLQRDAKRGSGATFESKESTAMDLRWECSPMLRARHNEPGLY
ncbi:MAG: hypothetical protein ACRD19_02670 [Terriglobia bacterium]